MNVVEITRSLVKSLNRDELQLCRRMLSFLDKRGEKRISKSLQLFELLITSEANSSNELSIKIYGEKKKENFSKLISRLRQKVMDCLLLDVNIERPNTYSLRSKTLYVIRKELSVIQILIVRGKQKAASVMLEQTIQKAKDLELFEDLLIGLKLKMTTCSYSEGFTEYNSVYNEYTDTLESLQLCFQVERLYGFIGAISTFKKWTNENNEFLREEIVKIEANPKSKNLRTVRYYLTFLYAQYYQTLNNYSEAEKHLKRQVDITINDLVFSQKSKQALAYVNLAQNYIYLSKYTLAETTAKQVIPLVSVKFVNGLYALEIRFFAFFYLSSYDKALALVNNLLKESEETNFKFQRDKWEYLKAVTLFMLNEFSAADQLLLKINEIETDKNGWNIAMRFMTVLNSIERKNFDIADAKIESTRKHISNIDVNISNRDKLIFYVLQKLSENSYNFNKTAKDVQAQINELSALNNETSWKLLTPECVIFQQWFQWKLDGVRTELKVPFVYDTGHELKIAQ